MPDNLTKKQRSYCMSRIKSKWTKQEKKIHNHLKGRKIKHQMHPSVRGNPDIILQDTNTLVFLHGCFWHKCPKCYKEPKTNKKYWLTKLENNTKRYRKVHRELKKEGWNVLRVWECQVKKDLNKVLDKMI